MGGSPGRVLTPLPPLLSCLFPWSFPCFSIQILSPAGQPLSGLLGDPCMPDSSFCDGTEGSAASLPRAGQGGTHCLQVPTTPPRSALQRGSMLSGLRMSSSMCEVSTLGWSVRRYLRTLGSGGSPHCIFPLLSPSVPQFADSHAGCISAPVCSPPCSLPPLSSPRPRAVSPSCSLFSSCL